MMLKIHPSTCKSFSDCFREVQVEVSERWGCQGGAGVEGGGGREMQIMVSEVEVYHAFERLSDESPSLVSR